MANYIGQGRTSYFLVNDLDAFTAAVQPLDVQFVTREQDGHQLVALLDDHPDGGGWLGWRYDEESGVDVDVDLGAVISDHITPGWVAIVQEVGWEKYRYLTGWAYAVNADNERRYVSIDDIPGIDKLGEHRTAATY